jgi:UDP-N-acetylmuramoyl-tripeptide--D-alanyl-D-alanine ligase
MKKLGKLILWQRASDYIKKYKPKLIGITGSTGKTMTKEAVAVAFGRNPALRISPSSYNTPIGVALSVLGIKRQDTTAGWLRLLVGSRTKELIEKEPSIIVLELGADRPGDIDFFARKLPFNIGVITNVRSTHLRLFVNKEMVAHEKMSLITDLPKDGYAILNADDTLVKSMAQHTKANIIYFGESEDADVRLRRAERLKNLGFACEILIQGKVYELHLPHIIARYQLTNVLAALSIVVATKGDIKQAIKRLHKLVPPPSRMRLLKGVNNSHLIDDSYNASPESTLAALNTLAELSFQDSVLKKPRRIAILGDMLDLGGVSVKWHEKIGEQATDVTDVLVTVGENMRHAGASALKTNDATDIHHFDDSRNVGKWLKDYIREQDVVLIKGSRNMHMEEIVKRLAVNYYTEQTNTKN